MSSMVVKPKERQFQVVPVPAVFTRGRWECVDYKDGTANGSSAAATIPSSAATPQNGREGGGASIQPAPSATPQFSIGPSEPPPASTTTTNTEFDNKSVISGGGGGAATPAACPAVASTTTTTTTAATGATAGPNSVAIDNKIEQAMDLVKTHLTFAVREEVEILRSTITDLELRVNLLENENQILRQFSPADVVANLPALVQQATQQQQKAAAAAHQQQAAAQKTFLTVPSAPVIMDTTSSSSSQQPPPPHAQHNADRQPQHQARRSSPTPGPGGGGGGDEIL